MGTTLTFQEHSRILNLTDTPFLLCHKTTVYNNRQVYQMLVCILRLSISCLDFLTSQLILMTRGLVYCRVVDLSGGLKRSPLEGGPDRGGRSMYTSLPRVVEVRSDLSPESVRASLAVSVNRSH